MNIDKYVEENPQRFEMIGRACRTLAIAGTAIDKATLSAALPGDFCLDDSDPWRMVASECERSVKAGTMTATEAPDGWSIDPNGVAAPTPSERIVRVRAALAQLDSANKDHWTDNGLPRESVVRTLAGDQSITRKDIQDATRDTAAPGVTNVTPENRETLAARLLTLQARACELRGELHQLTNARANARAAFADALQEWLSSRPKVTPLQAAKDFCAASVAERARQNGPTYPVAGPSAVDRSCVYSAGGTADDHVRKQMARGGHRRGAYPSSMRGATIRRDS